MRVPILERQSVAQSGALAPNLHVEQPGGFDSLRQGIAAVGQATNHMQAAVEKEQHEAAVVEARDNLTQYQHETTDTLHGASTPTPADAADAAFAGRETQTGFLGTKGKAAAESSADTLDELEEKRQKRAAAISNPKARSLFLQSSAEAYENTRRTVEGHVSQQIEQAKVDSIAAAQDEAMRAVALDPGNDALAQERVASGVGAIGGLGRGAAFDDVKASEFQQRVATTRLDALLSKDDVAGAQAVLTKYRWALGTQLDTYTKAVNIAATKQGADGLALQLVDDARGSNGFVDQAKAIESLQTLPAEKRTPQVEDAFNKWLHLEGEKQKTVTEQYSNRALSAYLLRHQLSDVDPKDELWLRNPANDPKAWHALEQMQKSDRTQQEGQSSGDQQTAMTRLMVDVADHPDKYATMSPEEFNSTWLPQLAKRDRPRAAALLAQMHTQANKPDKLSPVETQMLLQKGREAGVFDPKKNDVAKWDDEQAQNFYAAQQVLHDRIAAEKRSTGKSPDLVKIQSWVDELLLKGKDPERGFMGFGGSTTRLEAEAKGTGFEPKWGDSDKARAAEQLRKRGARVDDTAIDTVLRKVHGLPALPVQAQPAASPDEVAPGQWGLDLSESGAPPEREIPGKL